MHALNRLFKLSSFIALLGWAMLFLVPGWVIAHQEMVFCLAVALCLIYGYTLFLGGRYDEAGKPRKGHFFSMRGVIKLFESRSAVLAGWVHFLVFDLMIGLFIVIDAAGHDINHWLVVPILLLTLMLGPLGLLSYFALRLWL